MSLLFQKKLTDLRLLRITQTETLSQHCFNTSVFLCATHILGESDTYDIYYTFLILIECVMTNMVCVHSYCELSETPKHLKLGVLHAALLVKVNTNYRASKRRATALHKARVLRLYDFIHYVSLLLDFTLTYLYECTSYLRSCNFTFLLTILTLTVSSRGVTTSRRCTEHQIQNIY